MLPDIKEVDTILRSIDIDVHEQFYLDDREDVYGFLCYKLIVYYEVSSKKIALCFHVNTEPEYVSFVILKMTEHMQNNKGFSIHITESFSYDNDGNFITGENAYEVFEKEREKNIIENFITQQKQIHYLLSTKPYEA